MVLVVRHGLMVHKTGGLEQAEVYNLLLRYEFLRLRRSASLLTCVEMQNELLGDAPPQKDSIQHRYELLLTCMENSMNY